MKKRQLIPSLSHKEQFREVRNLTINIWISIYIKTGSYNQIAENQHQPFETIRGSILKILRKKNLKQGNVARVHQWVPKISSFFHTGNKTIGKIPCT
jgi:hypothetical protein